MREVLEGGEVSRGELLRRVERFTLVAVLRPDGCLAWTRSGRTQQRVGPVEWREGALRAGPFELGHFYSGRGGALEPDAVARQESATEPGRHGRQRAQPARAALAFH